MMDEDIRVPITHRTNWDTIQRITKILIETKPKYGSRNHFIEMAIEQLIEQEEQALKKRGELNELQQTNRKYNLESNSETNHYNTS